MNEVARRAGVSQSTVSVIVNGRDGQVRIAEQTKARVLAVIEELGFRPNLAARNLRLQRTRTIGFVTDHIAASPFAGRIVLGAQDVALSHDHLLILVNTAGDRAVEDTAIEMLLDRQVDSLLYAAMSWRSVDLPAAFASVPSILVNCWSDGSRLPADYPAMAPVESAGETLAARAVLAEGHREIAFIGGPRDEVATVEREQGFRAALAAAGVPVREEWMCYGEGEISDGHRTTVRLLDHARRPTALVCWNDRLAAGALIAVLERGLSVPGDVSVVGYDDQEGLADQLSPALTTVSIPHYEMGRAAVAALMAALATGRAAEGRKVPGTLIRRASLGPVKGG